MDNTFWFFAAMTIPPLMIVFTVIWSDTRNSRASDEGILRLVLRAERAENEAKDLKAWVRENNHGITPSIHPAPEPESPVRFTLRRITSPLRCDAMGGWFFVKIDSDHTAWAKSSDEWDDRVRLEKRAAFAEQRCRELEIWCKDHNRGRLPKLPSDG